MLHAVAPEAGPPVAVLHAVAFELFPSLAVLHAAAPEAMMPELIDVEVQPRRTLRHDANANAPYRHDAHLETLGPSRTLPLPFLPPHQTGSRATAVITTGQSQTMALPRHMATTS